MPCGKKAMNLVELIVVLSIMVVIYGIARISVAVVPRRGLEAAARGVVSDMRWARELAMSQGSTYCVRFSSNLYRIYNGTCGGSSPIIKRVPIQYYFIRADRSGGGSTNPPFDISFLPIGGDGNTNYDNQVPGRADLPNNADSVTIIMSDGIKISSTVYYNTKNITVFSQTGYMELLRQ